MNIIRKLLRTLLLLPVLPVIGAAEVDNDELFRIVSERTARAENAVLKDYFAQKGLDEEQSRAARDEFEKHKKTLLPDRKELAEMRRALDEAHSTEKKLSAAADAKVHMALRGVRPECFSDVLRLAQPEIDAALSGEGTVEDAVDGVLRRIPGLTGEKLSTGSAGNFPRADTAEGDMRRQLERARERHDNIAAAALISRAAEKGINLR